MSDWTTIVIFGASGDLTRRKLVPALFNIRCKGELPQNWRIVGCSRSKFSDEEFRERMESGVKEFAGDVYDVDKWAEFASNVFYRATNLTDVTDMRALDDYLAQKEGEGTSNRIYYLAIAPKLYEVTVANLGAAEMVGEDNGWRRVVIEKPFGHDLESAQGLNRSIHQVLEEGQVYRIDHYLGKETVQNLLVFRFANSLYEPVWNRNYIDHVQITAAESVDVGHRAGYYDGVGAVRDMVQNHMMQLLALTAMEPPTSFAANALRDEKVKVLQAIRPISPEQTAAHTVRAQYDGYCQTEGVVPDSQTETYTAIRFYIDNWRWQGVPFYLRTGKALAKKSTEITILFKKPPHLMFPLPEDHDIQANYLSICVQPDEGIHFSFQAKVPDTAAEIRPVDMSFHYADSFGPSAIPEAYERLLLDALKGDASLFTRGDAIEIAWRLVDDIIAGWQSEQAPPLVTYGRGSWGPAEADTLVSHDGFTWTLGCGNHD